MNDRAFKKGWIVVKAKMPRFCPQCMGSELELDTKEESIQEIKNRTGSYRYLDDAELKRLLQATMQGPDYWGYCLNCDYEFNPGM
tara:strand:- start:135 stop:389 length:255 start_codon:yes stop_codon:yes gene_type:complete